MIAKFAYISIFGIPIIAYSGFLALVLLLATAALGVLRVRGKTTIPFYWHRRLATLTIFSAFIHAFLGLSVYLHY